MDMMSDASDGTYSFCRRIDVYVWQKSNRIIEYHMTCMPKTV